MIAILLCAGYATRLYPLTRSIPKPLLPVADCPVIDYLMAPLAGLEDLNAIHVVTNRRFYGRFQSWRDDWGKRLVGRGVDVILHNNGSTQNANRLGACVDLNLVFKKVTVPNGTLVAAGDNIFNFDLKPLWADYRRNPYHRLVALPETSVDLLKKTGVPVFGHRNRVRAIVEKPAKPSSNWFCPPLYFLKPSAVAVLHNFLAAKGPADAPGHFINYLCRTEPVYAFRLNATRLDIGDEASYRRADQWLRARG